MLSYVLWLKKKNVFPCKPRFSVFGSQLCESWVSCFFTKAEIPVLTIEVTNRVALRHRHVMAGALLQVLSLSGEEM